MIAKLLNNFFNSPQLLLNNESKLEKAARKLCELRGINPDATSELIQNENGNPVIRPVWKAAEREIKAHLQVRIAVDSVS